MHQLLKALLMATGVGLLRRYRQVSVGLLKIHAVTAYVRGVQTVRRWWIGAILIALVLLLLAAGFIMIHVGFFLWVPWAPATKALALLLLGLLYMGVSLGVILKLCSEKAWMHGSQADTLVAEATRKS